METLVSKKCAPCEGGMPLLAAEEITKLAPQVVGWDVLDNKKNSTGIQVQKFQTGDGIRQRSGYSC